MEPASTSSSRVETRPRREKERRRKKNVSKVKKNFALLPPHRVTVDTRERGRVKCVCVEKKMMMMNKMDSVRAKERTTKEERREKRDRPKPPRWTIGLGRRTKRRKITHKGTIHKETISPEDAVAQDERLWAVFRLFLFFVRPSTREI